MAWQHWTWLWDTASWGNRESHCSASTCVCKTLLSPQEQELGVMRAGTMALQPPGPPPLPPNTARATITTQGQWRNG